jgi:hypothetical protein
VEARARSVRRRGLVAVALPRTPSTGGATETYNCTQWVPLGGNWPGGARLGAAVLDSRARARQPWRVASKIHLGAAPHAAASHAPAAPPTLAAAPSARHSGAGSKPIRPKNRRDRFQRLAHSTLENADPKPRTSPSHAGTCGTSVSPERDRRQRFRQQRVQERCVRRSGPPNSGARQLRDRAVFFHCCL